MYTTYQIVDDYAILFMEYQAKNAFGAFVLSSVKAKVTFDCRILSVGFGKKRNDLKYSRV